MTDSPLTIDAYKRHIMQKFKAKGLDNPGLDARLLLCAVLDVSQTELITQSSDVISSENKHQLDKYVVRRLAFEPVDKILGYRDFYGRRFKVSTDVLSPRPETEAIIDLVLAQYDHSPRHILDLGVGSGAILISLLSERPGWSGIGVDMSQPALNIAQDNAKALNVSNRLTLRHGNWFEPIKETFDIIISNPPYINKADMAELSPDVAQYDPKLSLYGGEDGADAYRHIIKHAPSFLTDHGRLIFEIGYDQAMLISKLLNSEGFKHIEVHKDLNGHDRIVTAKNS